MRISCSHGFFVFKEGKAGDIGRFADYFGFVMARYGEYFTFKSLELAKNYSIAGGSYLGAVATVTHEGEPGEVMRANDLVYDYSRDLVVPISTVTNTVKPKKGEFYFFSNGLILPGSITDDGQRVRDYSAWYSFDKKIFRYSEVILG